MCEISAHAHGGPFNGSQNEHADFRFYNGGDDLMIRSVQVRRVAGAAKLGLVFVFLLDAVVWLVVIAILLWLAAHYFPQLREAVQSIPSLLHQAADDIRT
jgi:hypothetical protein